MLKNLKLRKFLPLVLLVVLAIVAGGTNVFSETLQTQVIDVFKDYIAQLVPMSASIFVGLLVLCVFYILADPFNSAVDRALDFGGASERGQKLVLRIVWLLYWVFASFVVISFIAPSFLSKALVGVGLLGAALTLALQGLANDLIAGALLSFSPKVRVGDNIEMVGLPIKGTVRDIGYVMSVIENDDEVIKVANRDLWAKAVKDKKSGPETKPASG